MTKKLLFLLAMLLSSLNLVQATPDLIKFTPASGINATSPSSVTFTAELLHNFGGTLYVNSLIGKVTIGSISPMSVTATSTPAGGLSVNITVQIPYGLAVNDLVTIPVTLASDATMAPEHFVTANFVYTISTVLSAEMTSFNGKSEKSRNLLEWVTASEKDNDKFIVEQSTNGTDFKSIGEIKGVGTSQIETTTNGSGI